ncbi:MAG TPA: alcohol dehydrogenase [Planctomycetes bacterium]|nr:alcohol dehydrogenase [Planctomycetota bacterium]
MRGIYLEQGKVTLRDDLPAGDVCDDEVRIRPTLLGVCGTDLELMAGYYPFTGVLGHEFVGVVEEGPDRWLGKKVVGEINAPCGHCLPCQAGRGHHCPERTVLGIVGRDGCFADSFQLPARNLLEVPDGVPDECSVFTEPLAAAMRIPQQIDLTPAVRCLVVGDGRLGQLVARVLSRHGVSLTVLGRHERKLALLTRLGIETTTDSRAVDGGQYDVAIECSGNSTGFEAARQALRPLGTLVMKSTYAGQLQCDASALVVDEIELVGSRCGPFAPALAALAGGSIDPRDLIDEVYDLGEGPAALSRAAEVGVLKVLMRPS